MKITLSVFCSLGIFMYLAGCAENSEPASSTAKSEEVKMVEENDPEDQGFSLTSAQAKKPGAECNARREYNCCHSKSRPWKSGSFGDHLIKQKQCSQVYASNSALCTACKAPCYSQYDAAVLRIKAEHDPASCPKKDSKCRTQANADRKSALHDAAVARNSCVAQCQANTGVNLCLAGQDYPPPTGGGEEPPPGGGEEPPPGGGEEPPPGGGEEPPPCRNEPPPESTGGETTPPNNEPR